MKIKFTTIDKIVILEVDGILECFIRGVCDIVKIGTEPYAFSWILIVEKEKSTKEYKFKTKEDAEKALDKVWDAVKPLDDEEELTPPNHTINELLSKPAPRENIMGLVGRKLFRKKVTKNND